MSDDIIRQYTQEQTAKMRDDILRKHFAPFIGKVFAEYPALNSALLSVAQYWCDEAWDAVHGELAYSLHREPDIKAFYDRLREGAEEEEMLDYASSSFMEGRDTVAALRFPPAPPAPLPPKPRSFLDRLLNRPSVYVPPPETPMQRLLYGAFSGAHGGWSWDDNGEAIALFAAFCHEEGNQEENFASNYSPYVLFRRPATAGAPAEIEIVGDMIRPWLDGVGPREFDEVYPES
jgi:hypothetical protein